MLDGHVYNLDELGDDRTPDAGIRLARLYERFGPELLPRLRGDFALLLWDPATRTGLLARDQLGARPLHLHRNGGCLAFASELRNVMRLLPVSPAPDRAVLEGWLSSGTSGGDSTLFEGVRTLAPASWVELGRNGPSEPMRYWTPRYRTPDRMSADEASDTVRESVIRAVRRRAGDAHASAVLLSGGIDSATVAGVAASALDPSSRPRRGYTVTFPDHPEIDEGALTARVASAAGLEATSLRLRSGSVLGGALDYIHAWATPPSSPNLFFLRPILDRARDDGITTLLDGEGGDAVFWYAPTLLADRIRSGRLLSAWRLAGRFPEYGSQTTARARLGRLREWTHHPRTGEGPQWWTSLTDGIFGPGSRLVHDVSRRHAALTGLEPRHPLLDLDLIELALSLPPELAFDRRYNRPVIRHAMEGIVPDAVRLRPYKSRFDPVFVDGVLSDVPAMERLLTDPSSELRAYVGGGAARTLLDSRPAEPAALRSWCTDLWQLAIAECWLRQLAGKPACPADAQMLVSATAGDIASL